MQQDIIQSRPAELKSWPVARAPRYSRRTEPNLCPFCLEPRRGAYPADKGADPLNRSESMAPARERGNGSVYLPEDPNSLGKKLQTY